MKQGITFIDVETPNYHNDCISSIGIVNVDENGEVTKVYYLVNPEARFDPFNINLTKITPEMVANEPNFKQLWPKLENYFVDNLVVGHNVMFDLGVISACMQRYHIDIPVIFYACTYRLARALKVPSSSFKLNDLSAYYGVDLLNHHNAMDDTMACMEIFYHLLQEESFTSLDNYVKQYQPKIKAKDTKYIDQLVGLLTGIGFDNNLNTLEIKYLKQWLDKYALAINHKYQGIISELKIVINQGFIEHYQYLGILNQLQVIKQIKAENAKSLYEFMAILEGISCDEEINDEELRELEKWMQAHRQLNKSYPFKQIETMLVKVLAQKRLTTINEQELLYLIKKFFKPEIDQVEIETINDKVVCLTGNFNFGDRGELEKFILLKKGIVSSSVTKKVDYLVLGSQGSPGYKYGRYGSKVNKALNMQSNGHHLEIISEEMLMKVLKKN